MKVLVCGDRHWSNPTLVYQRIERLHDSKTITLIIEGGAPGADTHARQAAEALSIPFIQIDADWKLYGRAAGPIRNKEMLSLGPDIVLAFHNHIEQSKGTANMINLAKRAGIPVEIYEED